MANTRPYTREELKGLRRANLQNLFKIHNLKGANGTNSILIDSLVDYFASSQYISAHPPSIVEKEKPSSISKPRSDTNNNNNAKRLESRYKNVPVSKPIKTRVVSASIRRPTAPSKESNKPSQGIQRKLTNSSSTEVPDKPIEEVVVDERNLAGPSGSVEPFLPPQQSQIVLPNQVQTQNADQIQPSLPTPPTSSSSQTYPVSYSQVEAIISANDARWQSKLEALEKNLNDQMEKLRIEMNQLRNQFTLSTHSAGPSTSRNPGLEGGTARTWSPWEGRSVSQPLAGPSTSVPPFPILGKRRHPDHPSISMASTRAVSEGLDDHDRSEAKRVRFNGTRPGDGHDNTPLTEQPPSILPTTTTNNNDLIPRTPSPQKSSAFGADYFANPSLTPLPAHSSLIPRTPSPSRQGTIPDNSQTPKLPNDWQGDDDDDDNDIEKESLSSIDNFVDEDKEVVLTQSQRQKTPTGSRGIIPQFSTTPEPPSHRAVSPTMERSISASSDRFTPGRMINSTPSNPPSSTEERNRRIDQIEGLGIPLSTVTDLERIDEIDESTNSNSNSINTRTHKLISPNGQLNFPTIRPIPRLSGLGIPLPSTVKYPQLPPGQRTPSLLAPPALISRNSRAESELPLSRLRVGSRGLSPPTRPRSANAIHDQGHAREAATPPRTMFPLNLPEPDMNNGMTTNQRIRSASADYMHVAMHGLQADPTGSGITTNGNDGGDDLDFEDATTPLDEGNSKKRRNNNQFDLPTPGHRTLLGTERYNDQRFGDIPVSFGIGIDSGVWESPGADSKK